MKTNYQNMRMLDMIFENRNKAYGAYALRNDYNRRISRALLITFSSIVLLGVVKFFLDKMHTANTNAIEHIVVVEPIPEIHLEEKPEIKPQLPAETQSQAIQTERNVEMNVVEDNQQASDSVPTVADLRDAESGLTTNLNGNIIGATDGKGTVASFDPPAAPAVSSAVVDIAEIMPKYPGGDEALMKFLSKHTVYPEMLRDMEIGGKVVTQFTVDENGSISDIKVLKSPDKLFDREVTRVIKLLPLFTPGMQQGRPVRVRFILPFTFNVPD
jgi:protein TonB